MPPRARVPVGKQGLLMPLLERLAPRKEKGESALVEPNDGLDGRFYDMNRLQAAVMRDLEDLLNNAPLSQVIAAGADLDMPVRDLEEYPGVSETVINFGFPSLVGTTPGERVLEQLRQRMKEVLIRFEPRLDERSIRVDLARSNHTSRNDVSFRIQATLLGRPMPVIQTTTDLTSGRTGVTIAPVSAPDEKAS